jgi:hypothetical protein
MSLTNASKALEFLQSRILVAHVTPGNKISRIYDLTMKGTAV